MILNEPLQEELSSEVIAELENDLNDLLTFDVGAIQALNFTYDTSIDSLNYNYDTAEPTSITMHWWGSPSLHRKGIGSGVAYYLSNRSANVSAHYVATVQTHDGADIVYQIVADTNDSWHSGNWQGNKTSIGIEMMPFDNQTPQWQVEALLNLAAELVASLWHRWPNLKDKKLFGHKDWGTQTACPGNYYGYLEDIYNRAKALYPLYAGSFGKFNKSEAEQQPQKEDENMMYVISCPERGIALAGPGHFAPCRDNVDVGIAIQLSGHRVLETTDPETWDRWRYLLVGIDPYNATRLSDEDISRMADAVKGVSAEEIAERLKVVAK